MKEMVGGCCVCSDERGWTENPLVYCDGQGCTVAVHQGDLCLFNSSFSCLINLLIFLFYCDRWQRVMELLLFPRVLGFAGNVNLKKEPLEW